MPKGCLDDGALAVGIVAAGAEMHFATYQVEGHDLALLQAGDRIAHPHDRRDAGALGDLGCMLNIEGRLRRRGDTKTRVLHVAEVLAGERPGTGD